MALLRGDMSKPSDSRGLSYKSLVNSVCSDTGAAFGSQDSESNHETHPESKSSVGSAIEKGDGVIGGTYILYFTDRRLENLFANHSWKKCRRSLRVTWLLGNFIILANWGPWLMGVNRTVAMSFTVPIVTMCLLIFAQFAVIQLIPCLPRMSHSWVAPDTQLILISVLIVMLLPIANLHRAGVLISNDPAYFQDDRNYSSDVFLLLGLLMTTQYGFIVFPVRCSRMWATPVAGLGTYGLFSSPKMSPHPIGDMLFIIPSVGIMFFWCLVGRRRAEMQERKSWYRIHRLSADAVKMKASMQGQGVESPYEAKSQLLLNNFTRALDERNDIEIASLRQELVAHGFTEEDVQDKSRTIRKTLSEEAGVSVAYLISPEFEALATTSTGKEDPTFYDMKDAFFVKEGIGKYAECPRDGRKGCALIDTLPFQHRRNATHFLSWLWQYKLSSVRSSLIDWLQAENLDPNGVFLYMCFFVNNQYRILVVDDCDEVAFGSDNLGVIFESNVRRIAKVLAILEGWDSPSYLGRIWTIFEQYTAINLGVPVTIIMPPIAASTLIAEFEIGRQGIVTVKDALSRVDSESAKASVEEDEIRVKEFISSGVGFDVVNAKISSFMIAWVASQLQSYMNCLVHGDLSEDDSAGNRGIPGASGENKPVRRSIISI